MWYAQDIKDDIITRLQSSSGGVGYYLGLIDTKRATTTPTPLEIGQNEFTGQYPCVVVDIGDSTIDSRIGMTASVTSETFEVGVFSYIKDVNIDDVKKHSENYIEAIMESLQNYHNSSGESNYRCLAQRVIRADIDTENAMMTRASAVIFNVKRNFE